MGFYQNPVGPPDPFERYRVEGVGEKQTKDDQPKGDGGEPPEKQGGGVIGYLILILQKAIRYLLEEYGKADGRESRKTLLVLKNFFEMLKTADRSQDVQFLNQLAKTWNQALEESFNYKQEEAASIFKELVKKITHYPENQTHSFGYYLTEYAGQRWVPFPYMELVQKIHSEYQKDPDSSALSEWTDLIEEISRVLKEK